MWLSSRPTVFLSLFALLLSTLTACANSPVSKNLEQSFAADPQLNDKPVNFGQPVTNTNPQNTPLVTLPSDFPSDIPRYPNARLQQIIPENDRATKTRWTSSDSPEVIRSFYRKEFQDNNWQILSQTNSPNTGNIEARLNDIKVTVAISPTQQNATEFTIWYDIESTQATSPSTNEQTNTLPSPTTNPQLAVTPSPEVSIAPTPSTSLPPNTPDLSVPATEFSDINKAPQELRPYISELAQLGVLSVTPSAGKTNQSANSLFEPNKVIARRQFARWLIAANNRLQSTETAKQIRLATDSSQPAFQDVPKSDPDFAAIQGLAEAGIIPSPLSGDNTALLFRPDAPLTREQMMAWKLPLDTRIATSGATFEAIKQTWNFQDAFKIDPKVIKAVLADYQLADTSNIRRVFGYTTLFQPKKPVTRAEAAATIWHFGTQSEGISAKEVLKVKTQSNSEQPNN